MLHPSLAIHRYKQPVGVAYIMLPSSCWEIFKKLRQEKADKIVDIRYVISSYGHLKCEVKARKAILKPDKGLDTNILPDLSNT